MSGTVVNDKSKIERRGPSGINNRGSAQCNGDNVNEIAGYIEKLPDDNVYESGFHIACTGVGGRFFGIGGHCAFLQGTGHITGRQVKGLIKMLNDKSDVSSCGSVPVALLPEFGGINELGRNGMLTVNFVTKTDNPCPPGLCGAGAPPPIDPSACPAPRSKRRAVPEVTAIDPADIVAEWGPLVQASSEKQQKRQDDSFVEVIASRAAELAQRITTAAGVQLEIMDIADTQPLDGLCPLVDGFTALVPKLASELAVTGPASDLTKAAELAPFQMFGILNTKDNNNAAGPLNPNDLDKIIGAMAHRLVDKKIQATVVKFRTLAGALAVTLTLGVFVI